MGERRAINGFWIEKMEDGTFANRGPVSAAPAMPSAVALPVNPIEAAKDARTEARQDRTEARQSRNEDRADRTANRVASDAARPTLKAGYMWGPDGKSAVPIPGISNEASGDDMKDSAKARVDAITQYQAAQAIRKRLVDMRAKFKAGPGSTSGIMGAKDFAPTPANEAFDKSAQAVRGQVGKLLGFTGGELNSVAEAAAAVGPYIPQSGNFDGTSEDTMDRLEELAGEAEARSVAILGGIPDANGKVTPLGQRSAPQVNPQANGSGSRGADGGAPNVSLGGPSQTVATGATRNQYDAGASKALDRLIRKQTPFGEVQAWAQRNGHTVPDEGSYRQAVDFARNNSGHEKLLGEVTRQMPNSWLNRAMASPAATIATQAANAATMGSLDEIGGGIQSLVTGQPLSETIAAADAAKQAQAKLNWKSALTGNIIGGAGAVLGGGALLKGVLRGGAQAGLGRNALAWAARNPIKANLAADGAYGTGYGLGEFNDNRLAGAGVGAVSGIVGNRIGAGIARGGGAVMRGVVNPAAQRLRERGIDLTGGEIAGGWVKGIEDRLEGFPLVGDMLARRNDASRRQLVQAAFNEGGATVGVPINAVGAEGIERLGQARSNAYDQALGPVNIDANNPAFLNDMTALVASANRIPPVNGARDAAANAIENRIGGAVNPATDTISRRGFQEAYRGFARTSRERAAGDYGHEVGQVMRQGQDALLNALPPDALAGFMRANSANRHLSVLTDATNTARNQLNQGDAMFTPAQLGAAATNNAKTYGGKLSAAIGDRPFDQLARDAQEVMSSKVGDPGTAGRVALGVMMGAGGGMGYGADGAGGATAGALGPAATMALLNTRAGQAAVTRALLQRTAAFRNGGQSVINAAPRIGDFTGLASILGGQSLLPPR